MAKKNADTKTERKIDPEKQNPLDDEVYKERVCERKEDPRGHYFRDQTAIIHSMPFRRLKHKTQLFYAPEDDHVCTRMEHVLHVGTIAASICKGLNDKETGWNLDTELAMAIGFGHDIGHAPFGHTGESALTEAIKKLKFYTGKYQQFHHEIHGYRVVAKLAKANEIKLEPGEKLEDSLLEKKKKEVCGLKLTYAVMDGIISHNGEKFERSLRPHTERNDLDEILEVGKKGHYPTTYEGCIVRFADKIAYLGRDIEDAMEAKLIKPTDIPDKIIKKLGDTNGKMIDSFINDIITESCETDQIQFSEDMYKIYKEFKDFLYDKLIGSTRLQEYRVMGKDIVISIFEYLLNLYGSLGDEYEEYIRRGRSLDALFGRYLERMRIFYEIEKAPPYKKVLDYVAGMTDFYALNCMHEISIPKPIEFRQPKSKEAPLKE